MASAVQEVPYRDSREAPMQEAGGQQTELARIKGLVRKSYDYFKPNYDRFNDFRRFVFQRSLTEDDCTLLETIGRPQLEFNILEAYISRLLGEFSKQEPSIEVHPASPGAVDSQMISLVLHHARACLSNPIAQKAWYEIYKDILSGGFSVAKVTTDWAGPMSFDQEIRVERAFDPTMCGFDPLARDRHKGDGEYCFELSVIEKNRFMEMYPDIDIDSVSFVRGFAGFNWSYTSANIEYVLVCDWYQKKRTRMQIVHVRDGRVMEKRKYDKMVAEWALPEVPPAIIGEPRWTERMKIQRIRLMETQVIEKETTDLSLLPLVFFDGNSVMVKTPKNGNVEQVTRPYVYHARGAQRLKNFAGISLANEIENTVQHKFMVAKEALPKEGSALEAYEDTQKASVLIFNAFDEHNPDKAIPNPIREVVRQSAPAEIIQAFTGSDSLIQNVLGSYDASLGINDNQLSGVAVVEAASQSNAAAMPYIVGFMHGYQRVAECYVSLFPKLYTTPRTVPVKDAEGNMGYVEINKPGMLKMEYDPAALMVNAEAGPAFRVQKSKALQQLVALQQASPMFAQFMAEKGLPYLLANVDMLGIEGITEAAIKWMEEMEQKKAAMEQAQQQAQQQNPMAMKMAVDQERLQKDRMKDAQDYQVSQAKMGLEKQRIDADLLIESERARVQRDKAATERMAKGIDLMERRISAHRRAGE